jgi:hypothetical protein
VHLIGHHGHGRSSEWAVTDDALTLAAILYHHNR